MSKLLEDNKVRCVSSRVPLRQVITIPKKFLSEPFQRLCIVPPPLRRYDLSDCQATAIVGASAMFIASPLVGLCVAGAAFKGMASSYTKYQRRLETQEDACLKQSRFCNSIGINSTVSKALAVLGPIQVVKIHEDSLSFGGYAPLDDGLLHLSYRSDSAFSWAAELSLEFSKQSQWDLWLRGVDSSRLTDQLDLFSQLHKKAGPAYSATYNQGIIKLKMGLCTS